MKESLRLLNVGSSSLEDAHLRILDSEIYQNAKNISDLTEKINYLKEQNKEGVSGNPVSKRHLAWLLRGTDVEQACDLMFSVCTYAPSDPENYLVFAEIAYENKAWLVAKSALEVVRWLCNEKDKETLIKAESLLSEALNKIKSGENDSTNTPYWKNKPVDKYWILDRVYYQGRIKDAVKLSFKLLDVFNNDLSSYDIVFKILSLSNEQKYYDEFKNYTLNLSKISSLNKKLYVGMICYAKEEYESSVKLLGEVISAEPTNGKAVLYLSLNYLLIQDIKNFVKTFNKIIPGPGADYIALFFIYSAFTGNQVERIEFPNQKNISSEASKIIERLLKKGKDEIVDYMLSQFKKLGYHIILPYLNLYLAELFIKQKKLDKAKELLADSKDEETHRLWAWIYRIEGNNEKAEMELAQFRKKWIPDKNKGITCNPVPLNVPNEIPDSLTDIKEVILRLYKQTKEFIAELDLEYGLNAMTCIETGCQDCCKKTFPLVSYIEYLYLKDYLEKQPEEFRKKIYEKSLTIVNKYREMYKKEPPLILGGREIAEKEYPSQFQFDCPCLGDNKCNIYEGRPFTCRAYGFSTADRTRYKGCNYFFEQFKGATKLYALRKVLDMNSFIDYASKVDVKLIGKHVIAPIPVWLAYSHEDNLERIKNVKLINS